MLICVTNRKLCKDDFFNRINQIAQGKPRAIILREKDLSLSEYECLAIRIKEICDINKVPLIINQNIEVASKLKISNIQLSLPCLRAHKNELHQFDHIGTSVHSVIEAKEAQVLGASYLIAGHIFPTDCKKGVPPRGLLFSEEVCDSVVIPVFAIGGITKDKIKQVTNIGAKGICVMNEPMTCLNPVEFISSFLI